MPVETLKIACCAVVDSKVMSFAMRICKGLTDWSWLPSRPPSRKWFSPGHCMHAARTLTFSLAEDRLAFRLVEFTSCLHEYEHAIRKQSLWNLQHYPWSELLVEDLVNMRYPLTNTMLWITGKCNKILHPVACKLSSQVTADQLQSNMCHWAYQEFFSPTTE